jgi:hypothetical protein
MSFSFLAKIYLLKINIVVSVPTGAPLGATGLSYMKIKRTVLEIIPSIIFSVISGTLSTIQLIFFE